MDVADFNARWLAAWSAKDVEGLLTFYAADARYFDPNTVGGIAGHDALRAYLTRLFAATPAIAYKPDEIWPTAKGFCGRWYAVIGDDPAAAPTMRGFDLVVLEGDKIALNEVYVHTLQPA